MFRFTVMSRMLRPVPFVFALFLQLFFSFVPVCGQTAADRTMGELLNDSDLFRLEAGYSRLKDSLTDDVLRLLAEARLGVGFNRLDRAAGAMDSLLIFHQEALGQETLLEIASLRAMNLLNLGYYEAAGAAAADLVDALAPYVPFESLFGLVFIERMGRNLAGEPAPALSRPRHEVRVPFRVDSVSRGHQLLVPVEVNGLTRDFIFDTGCSFGNFVSERYARDAGLTMLADSIPVSGLSVGFVQLATADSMRVGELTLHHPVFLVAPPDPQVDSLYAFDGVLDNRFLCAVGVCTLDNESGEVLFPVESVRRVPNLYFVSNQPRVRITCGGEPLDLVFDTGNVKSDLGTAFARQFPAAVACHRAHAVQRGGFGGMVTGRGVTLPTFAFELSDTPVELRGTEVVLDMSTATQNFATGSLGADFVLYFKRLTIDYRSMALDGEPW